ncbi:MAG: hypothetical protein JXA69_18560 [Phycisphaerae bacterium]|nr:hypothetical protein [Phycisphaerae bacterium]
MRVARRSTPRCLERGGYPLGSLLLGVLLLSQGLAACGDCASTAREWHALVKRADVVACSADSDCILVGQTSTCDCSESMAGNGVAVNGAAYQAAGGERMLTSFYLYCREHMPVRCCDCAPRSTTGCVDGRCAIVQYGCCVCQPDGGRPWSQPDAGIDVPEPVHDSN